MAALDSVPEVLIDPNGLFKYILVRVSPESAEPERHRDIVRGTKSAEYHNHIFEKLDPEMKALGLTCKCLGGGKIDHNSKDKKIRVFGESTVRRPQAFSRAIWQSSKAGGYGKADHSVTAEKLRNKYSDYEVVWSDEKK
ncbi:14 kDa phosphohistidine phosphatase-like isoform X1 [Dendropsophus ebraccatus]|uniref:14 kDa phosphohistidine phosphatase-like isoform X1 n=1 Tax=Dendropsophus ebraccatus TaxID=150705 RepID=UPI003832138A